MINIEHSKRGFNTQEAMKYLGVKRKAFEKHFKPYLTPLAFGTAQLYDRLDLDRIWEEHKRRNERLIAEKGETKWAENKVASTVTTKIDGALIKSTAELDFESVSKRLKRLKTG